MVFMLLAVLYLAAVGQYATHGALSRAEIIVAPFFGQVTDAQPDQYTVWDHPFSKYLNPFFLIQEVIR